LSAKVVEKMRSECAKYPTVETGGLLLGVSSERCRTVTVVDLLDAPPDSVRSATEFRLGTKGLRQAIADRFDRSGMTIFDVGTWHSHLSDSGPSFTDRKTAAQLAAERPPPSALLIVCPTRYYGLMHRR
jgi:integrative and conjugative element protein (TIGR02256 family)